MPEDKTPAVFDFDAIRSSIGERDAVVVETTPSLAALIAEEKAAWKAYDLAHERYEDVFSPWHLANPELEPPDHSNLPEPMGALYRQAEEVAAVAKSFTDRICAWIPDTATEAAALLEWQEHEGSLFEPLLDSVRPGTLSFWNR
jgi:hypothetical protein